MTSTEGEAFLMASTALCTTPLSSEALLPTASLCSGMPNNSTPATPASAALDAASVTLSTDSWLTPGIEATGFSTPLPGQTK